MDKILNNISIRSRMLLSVALFLATLGFSMYSALTSIGANIDFAVKERYGNQYQRPLAEILHATGKLRVEIAKHQLGHGDPSIILKEAAAIGNGMKSLKKEQDSIGEILQFTDEGLKSRGRESLKYETVLAKWTQLSNSLATDPKKVSDPDISSFITDIRGMIGHSGDTSNLILDPDLDSYYLMDATLLALPQALDRLAAIGAALPAQLDTEHQMTVEEKTEAAVLARMVSEADLSRLKADMDTSLKEDPNFYGTSTSYQQKAKKWVADYEAKNTALIESLNAIASGKSVSLDTFNKVVAEAQESTHLFLKEGYDELDRLLDYRIASYKGDQVHSIMVSLAGIAVSILFFFLVVRTITNPLEGLTKAMRRLAANDLSADISYTAARSEIGLIASSVAIFKDNAIKMESLKKEQQEKDKQAAEEKRVMVYNLAQHFESNVGHIVHAVASASTELQGSAESLSGVSQRTTTQASSVAAASEQTSLSVQVLASAAEELSSSIGEISRQVGEANNLISGAVQQIYQTNETVKTLAESSAKIGAIVDMITDIASQTNLLALNATIEAARAGEAGKGFAVVASEVKNLAGQTGKATEEISTSISAMQEVTHTAVNAIQEIAKIIETINDVSNNIAAAVTQQSSATHEIAKNIQHVSDNTTQVSSNIFHVTTAAKESMKGSHEVLNAASELSEQSEKLRTEVSQFIHQIKAS